MELEIIFQDEHLVAINKPPGMLVHRTPMAKDATEFALQILREQIGQKVYPVHRLDRKTSGVLLFALSPEMNSLVQKKFAQRQIRKHYLAIVRGWTTDSGTIDYDLKNKRNEIQSAVTEFKTIEKVEIEVPFGKHPTSRYSLVELIPDTGRFHQLRKHMAHIFHPIIGDRPHGCNKQNRFWKEKFGLERMLLHAARLSFKHPASGKLVEISASTDDEFKRSGEILGLKAETVIFNNQ